MNILNQILTGIEKGDLKVVRRLLKEHPYLFHFDIPHGWPVLHRCLAKRCIDLELVELFIANGGEVNRKTNSGVSMASLAATIPDGGEIFKFLTSSGARISALEEGMVALTTDLNEDRAQMTIMTLVNNEPDLVKQPGDDGFTLLHHALVNFRYAIVGFLLDRGANPNAITHTGKSPLGLCGEPQDEQGMACYELLIAKGATYTPIESLIKMIRDDEDQEVIKLLKVDTKLLNAWYPQPFGSLLHIATWLGKGFKLVDYLLKRRVDPNTPNEQGETALHRVMHRTTDRRTSSLELIRLLVRHGADINRPAENGYTPLHEAARHPWEEPVKLLVEMGAAINAKTGDGETVLDVVHSMKFLGHRSLAHWLKTKGACSG